ncbi:hypothetical protein ACLESO_19890 [Pyxidicoccus sp. 3LG]
MLRSFLFILAVVLFSCTRNQGWRPAPFEEDTSIIFPAFFEREAVQVGALEQSYDFDGVMLRAIAIAANDFLPPDSRERSCWNRQESYRYRVIRQGEVVFVHISADAEHCTPGPRMLDGGAKYAISSDGRILRRVFDGQPEQPLVPEPVDAGAPEAPADASIPVGDTTWGEPLHPLPSRWLDGGT